MGRTLRGVISALLLVAVAAAGFSPVAHGESGGGTETGYIVDFGSSLPADAEGVISAAGGSVKMKLSEIGVVVASSADKRFASRAGIDPRVQSVAVDSLVSWTTSTDQTLQADTIKGSGKNIPSDGIYASDGWNIKRVGGTPTGAWGIEKGSHSVVVAIMDTGIYARHPDLAPNYLYARSFVTGEDEGDYNGHGTFVAGIVGGALGGGAIVGVGPGLGLADYKVLNSEREGRWSWLLAAIYQAANDGARVANMSLGAGVDISTHDGQVVWQVFHRAATYARQRGLLLVAAGENEGIDLRSPEQAGMKYVPLQLPGVVGVSATTKRDQLAFYSNYGSGVINLAAPGGDLGPDYPSSPDLSYLIRSSWSPLALKGVLYARGAGTSFATPHVSGVAGLVASRWPGLGPDQIAVVLQERADDLGSPGYDARFGFGLINARAALAGK